MEKSTTDKTYDQLFPKQTFTRLQNGSFVSTKFPYQYASPGKEPMKVQVKNQKNKNKKGSNVNSKSKLTMVGQVPSWVAEVSPQYITRFLKELRFQTDSYTVSSILDIPCTTDSSGVLQQVFGNSPSTSANWTNFVACFDEYRTLGMVLEFEPNKFNGGATVVNLAPIATVIDYDTVAAITGYTQAAQYSSHLEFGGGRKWRRISVMAGVENSNFISTLSPVTTFSIKIWSQGNIISTTIGRYKVSYVVQFRGKGI